MKTMLFVVLLVLMVLLAAACGYFLHAHTAPATEYKVVDRLLADRDMFWRRQQLNDDLRILRAIDIGRVDEVRAWSNLRINSWMVRCACDPRPEPFPCEADDTWVIQFLAAVDLHRTSYPSSTGYFEVDQTLAEIQGRARVLDRIRLARAVK